MALGIAMLAYKRPRYLYVALDSLFRVQGIEDCHVGVFVDYDPDTKVAMQEVISQFNVRTAVFQPERLNELANRCFSLSYMCDMGLSELLYLEEDVIIRTDTLRYIEQAPRDAFFLSLHCTTRPSPRGPHYYPIGNLVTSQDYARLRDWIDAKKYYGLERPATGGRILGEQTVCHDGVFYAFLVATGYETKFAPVDYVAHFGVLGSTHNNPDEATVEVESRMFSGPRDTWMDNVLREFQDEAQPSSVRRTFVPESFVYQ